MTTDAQKATMAPPPETPQKPRRNLAQRLLSGAAWAFGAKIIGVTSGLAINAFLARMLPTDEMGAYFLITSVVMFAAIVARFGLKQTVVRLVAESMATGQPGRARATLRIVYVIVTLGALIVGGGYYLGFGTWLAEDVFSIPVLASVTGLTALWIAVLAFQTPVAETFRGLHDIRLAVFLDGILASALLASVLAVFWFNGLKVDFAQAVLLSLVMAGVSLLFGMLLFLRRVHVFEGEGDVGTKEVVAISSPLFVTNIANQAMTNFSLWIAGAYLVAEDVALYGAAWKLVALVSLPLLLMNMSVQPFIAQLYVTDKKARLQNALRGTATLAGVPAMIVLIAFILAGATILEVVYGTHYREAATVLTILSLGLMANVATGSCGMVLALTGHQKALMQVTIAASLISVSLTVLGAQYGGLVGIASGVAVGRALQNLLNWLVTRRKTGLWTHATVSPSFVGQACNRVLSRST
ncbi:MAG: oligosaccharide flippase family protein [Gammaproteobacteria bacterium]|nr:oligosaccharide flippase family protein [Gammaproteobacteria bacterium]